MIFYDLFFETFPAEWHDGHKGILTRIQACRLSEHFRLGIFRPSILGLSRFHRRRQTLLRKFEKRTLEKQNNKRPLLNVRKNVGKYRPPMLLPPTKTWGSEDWPVRARSSARSAAPTPSSRNLSVAKFMATFGPLFSALSETTFASTRYPIVKNW